jgi:hypothetical protein
MTDLLLTLVLLGVVAALEAAIQAHDAPPSAAPRRNYDVLAPSEPRSGATRANVDAQTLHDLRLARHIFGPKAGTVVTIRPEARDGQ